MTSYHDTAASSESNASRGTGTQGTSIRDRAQDAGKEAIHRVQETSHEIAHKAQELGEQGKEVVSEYYQQGCDQARVWKEQLEHQIRDKPLSSLAIAGGIGLVLGLLWRR